MIVFRLSKEQYMRDLSGRGAELVGGRWNSKGHAVLYTSENRALCTAEIAVHIPLGIVPVGYFLISLEIPDDEKPLEVLPEELPKSWRSFPHPISTQDVGDRFIREEKHLVLKVPSAVIPGEFNYLLNPKHPGFTKVRILKTEPFAFDQRLFDR